MMPAMDMGVPGSSARLNCDAVRSTSESNPAKPFPAVVSTD